MLVNIIAIIGLIIAIGNFKADFGDFRNGGGVALCICT
jgi:hypothetical protein